MGLGDAYHSAALGYLSHQEIKKNSRCFLSIETVEMEQSLAELTRELFGLNREMLHVYLDALPFFCSFLAERNLVAKDQAEAVKKEIQRLKREGVGPDGPASGF